MIDQKLRKRLDEAFVSLGRLDSITALLPDKRNRVFWYESYVRILNEGM